MEETLTVTRLGITGKLKHTLQSTNPIESMISTVRVIHRNVKHWTSGEMCLRWTAAGMLEAETRFRKVQGYRGLANLAVAIEHDLIRRRNTAHEGAHHRPHCVTMTPGPPSPKFHDDGATSCRSRAVAGVDHADHVAAELERHQAPPGRGQGIGGAEDRF